MSSKEIYIDIKGIGFVFLLDKKKKHNFISPAFLNFFNIGEKQKHSPTVNKTEGVDITPAFDNTYPFHPAHVNGINTKDVFRYVGKKVGKCSDNRLRLCKVFILKFEYESQQFSFPFLLDKGLNMPAILGQESYSHISVKIKKKQET